MLNVLLYDKLYNRDEPKGSARMEYKIGKSNKEDAGYAVEEATAGFRQPKLVIFISDVQGFEAYTELLHERFNEATVLGVTTYVSLCQSGAYKNTLLVIGIESGIECAGGVLEEVDKYPIKYVECVQKSIRKISSTQNTICLEFSSGLISSEELILTTLNSVLEDKKIPVFGGTAGNDGKTDVTLVSYNGKVYQKACVFALVKNLNGRIKLYRENIYKPASNHFIATKVDERNRIVYEYDNKPAARVMAEALGTTIDKLPKYLDQNPVGRIIGDEMYITANKEVTKEQGMAYHARVYQNAQMVLLEPDEYRRVIEETIAEIQKDVPHPSLALMVHCLARSILFESQGYLNEYAQKMGRAVGDFVGSSGYGEQLGQQHFNQTMVIAVFE